MDNSRNQLTKVIVITLILMTALSITLSAVAAGNSAFLATAKKCKKYLVDNKFTYRSGGKTYPIDASKSKKIDCSGYVGWAIYEYQGGNFECKGSSWYLKTAKALYAGEKSDSPKYTRGWKAIKGWENFQPGDILCYSGHVHIYYGPDTANDGKYLVLNAGENKALKSVLTNIRESYFKKAQYAIRLPKK